LVGAVLLFTAHFAVAQEKSGETADKVSVTLEFGASLLAADSEGVVDSMTDAGFNEDETKLGFSYEDELWGASASLKFGNENLRIFFPVVADNYGSPLSIDELYVWIKPFGEHFKFIGGVFENADGVADYTDDLDDFRLGVFRGGAGGVEEPHEITTAAVWANGFLTSATFGPIIAQFMLAPNYSKESATEWSNSLANSYGLNQTPGWQPIDAGERLFRFGGRIIGAIEGFGTISALYKMFQWPMEAVNVFDPPLAGGDGAKAIYHTFGTYINVTAVESLGVSAGYTGYMAYNDASGVDNILWSGIDLRVMWTGLENVSLSSHNNISFAKGTKNEWSQVRGDGSSFFNLYNAIGATVTLSDRFSVNIQIGNIFSNIDIDAGKSEEDTFWLEPKFIAAIGENAEFSAGLRLDLTKTATSGNYGEADETVTTFSVPVGIKVSF
jgi:hypothetical protein